MVSQSTAGQPAPHSAHSGEEWITGLRRLSWAMATPSGAADRTETAAADAAFARYVTPELDVLYRVALSITRKPADAEDLVQDTLLRAYRSIERFDGRYPRAWLLTIMRNAQINRVRRKRPELLREPRHPPAIAVAALDRRRVQ